MLLGALATVAWGEPDKRERRHAEMMLRVVEARSIAGKGGEDAASLIPAELKNLLRFKHYRLLDSAYVRGREDETMRIALAATLACRLRFEVEDREAGRMRVGVDIDGAPDAQGKRNQLLETETFVKNGETVVLGASRMQGSDRALIVLFTARLLP